MGRGLRVAFALAAAAVASTAACSLLVPVDGLAGADAPDAARLQDAPIGDAGADSLPPDASADASDDTAPTRWTLFADELPVSPADPSAAPLEIGVRFTVSAPGDVEAIRFFRTVSNPSGYVVHLWGNGVLLATADVASDDGKPIGWREQAIAPVRLQPSTVYIASYFTSNGACSFTAHGFTSPLTRGPLTAPASGDASTDGNGVFDYTSNPLVTPPTSSFEQSNYFVDVQFAPAP